MRHEVWWGLVCFFCLGCLPVLPGSTLGVVSAQQVRQEDPTPQELARDKVFFGQISPKEQSYGEDIGKLDQPEYYVGPRVSGKTKAKLEAYILLNEKVLYYIQERSFKQRCAEINRLRKSINEYFDDLCSGILGRARRLEGNISWAKSQKSDIREEKGKDNDVARQLEALDNALETGADSLKEEKAEFTERMKGNKAKSFDDFLAEKSENETGEKADFLADTGGDFLANSTGSAQQDETPSGGDFLASEGGDFLAEEGKAEAEDGGEKNYRVSRKNGKTGVEDLRGRMLIPFRDWSIVNYKDGIAEVSVAMSAHTCSNESEMSRKNRGSLTAYRNGFVDKTGEFLDDPTISFSYYATGGLYLVSRPRFNSDAERRAYDRRVAVANRRAKLAYQACKRERLEFKNHILAKYK